MDQLLCVLFFHTHYWDDSGYKASEHPPSQGKGCIQYSNDELLPDIIMFIVRELKYIPC